MVSKVELTNGTDALTRLESNKNKKRRRWIIRLAVVVVIALAFWISSKFPTKKDMLICFVDEKQVEYLEVDHPKIDDKHSVWFAAFGLGGFEYTPGKGYETAPMVEILLRGPDDTLFEPAAPRIYLDGVEVETFTVCYQSGGYWTEQTAILLFDVPEDLKTVTLDFDGTVIELSRATN